MSQTLINVNQNQLNNQNGSYVELIKNTQQAKVNLTTALVNKGADVSSSSTFTEMITAVNNLATISGSFTAVKGTYISGSSNITQWSRANDRATYIIVNDKGVFAYHIINATTLRVASLNGYDYNSNSSALLTTTLTIDASGYIASGSTIAANYRRFFMNTDGSKLWCINADGTKINEYSLDYSGVSSENPVNVSITLSQSLVMASSLNNATNTSAVLAVNESKKKILIFDPASALSSQISITANSYIIDYSNGITDLTKESVLGDIGNISTAYLTNFPLNMTENVLYQQNTASFIDIKWDENKLEIHTQITTNLIGIPTVLQYNNQRFISYTEGSIDATYNNQLNVRLLDLDTYSIIEKTFLVFCVWNTSYTSKDFCLPQKVGDKIFLTGLSIGTLVELKIENSEVVINPIPSLAQMSFTTGNDHSNVGQLLYDGNNGFCAFRFTGGGSTMSFAYLSGTMNKLISYIYNDENNNHIAFTPYNESAFNSYLNFPQTEVLVEDN